MTNSSRKSIIHALAGRFGVPDSPRFERILEMILSAEEMLLLLAMPGRAAEIARAVGRAEQEVVPVFHDLYMRGVVSIDAYENGQPVWSRIALARFMDSILIDPRYARSGDEFYDLWRALVEEELIPQRPPDQDLRILPVEKVLHSTRILDIESARAIVKHAGRAALQHTVGTVHLSQ